MSELKLMNGTALPLLGLGTWKAEPGEVGAAVGVALELGYRHLDCAPIYGNEAEIGEALEKAFAGGGVKREELLVELRAIFHTRNIIGAHYNELAGHFNSLAEAVDLGRRTLALAEALTGAGGQLPTCRRSGSCWKIRGSEALRLHPLLTPN